MRIATFNVENLFSRARVLNVDDWAEGRPILNDIEKLTALFAKPTYETADKKKMVTLLTKYGFDQANKKGRPFEIIEARDKLFSVHRNPTAIEIVASGRDSWVGWIELARDDFKNATLTNTGRVIAEVKAEVQLIVEVENRTTLDRFNEQVLTQFPNLAFPHNLLIDGNDPRGIDIGLYSRLPIASVRSHIDDTDNVGIVFSRDCAEYELPLANGQTLWLLGNHFKSKGFGSQTSNDKKRKRQAERVKAIYNQARTRSDFVIVAGDLNDSPDRDPLQPLVAETDLKDVMSHPSYQGKPGTFHTGTSLNQKIDYIFLSPALWTRVQHVGVERRGIFAKSLEHFDTVTSTETSASDHAAVWVDLDL